MLFGSGTEWLTGGPSWAALQVFDAGAKMARDTLGVIFVGTRQLWVTALPLSFPPRG